jgi:dethiobiotin synthetase
MACSIYITGTDTDAGKTFATCALLHALRSAGLRAAGMKPIASGAVDTPQGLRSDDALALQRASHPTVDYATVNPIVLRTPTAPEIAAAIDGVSVDLAPLHAAHRRLCGSADWVLVEGVGGWMAPLSTQLMQVDLVRALQLPVVLVVGLRLGCINHALLTQRALDADGVQVLGWIGSAVDPQMAHVEATCAILRQRLTAPCLGILAHGSDAQALSAALNLQPLLAAGAALRSAGAG